MPFLQILWNKVEWLTKAANLKPWYKAAIEAGSSPTPPPGPPSLPPPPPPPPSCTDIPPDSIHTCAQQVGWGKCGLWWMEASGKCLKSCGACGSPPTATTTPGLALTLAPTLVATSAPASLPALPPEVHGDVEAAAVVGTIEGDLGPTTPSPPSTFACTAQINTHTWQSSSTTWSASVNVTLTANSTRSVPYYASLYNLAYIETTAAWNWYPAKTPTSGWITGIVTESWQALGDGASAQVALIVSGRSPDLQPSAFTVADTLCMIQTAA